jgi:hypothetical protein
MLWCSYKGLNLNKRSPRVNTFYTSKIKEYNSWGYILIRTFTIFDKMHNKQRIECKNSFAINIWKNIGKNV